jgi:hypothetical protein
MVDLENNNLNISLLAEENISSALINENLQVVFDTSANISIKPALSYIKSGQKEISDYVADVAEPRLSEYVQTAENQMQNCVDAVQKFADDIVDKGFVKTADLQNALEGKQNVISDLPTIRNGATLGATAVQPSALNGYATQAWVGAQGYITGITSGDVTTALGYTPYNSSNPSGYITNSALTPYALSSSLATVATSGSYNDLSNKPDLNGKADIDLSNCTKPHIVEIYNNGTSWYRVYSDGWCEQGGRATISSYYANITFLKQFVDTNYNIGFAQNGFSEDTYCANVQDFTNSTMRLRFRGGGTFCFWQACGYI